MNSIIQEHKCYDSINHKTFNHFEIIKSLRVCHYLSNVVSIGTSQKKTMHRVFNLIILNYYSTNNNKDLPSRIYVKQNNHVISM